MGYRQEHCSKNFKCNRSKKGYVYIHCSNLLRRNEVELDVLVFTSMEKNSFYQSGDISSPNLRSRKENHKEE